MPEQEMDDDHRSRTRRLVRETSGKLTSPEQMLLAYIAILLKDLLSATKEVRPDRTG
jgi:hypothetical protein